MNSLPKEGCFADTPRSAQDSPGRQPGTQKPEHALERPSLESRQGRAGLPYPPGIQHPQVLGQFERQSSK
jgi:hypothetical protein